MLGVRHKFPNLPERISGLGELAYNLWWSWHPEGRELFKILSRTGWHLSVHNPVMMLHQLDQEVLSNAAKDPHFLRHYDAVMARFEKSMDLSSGWFCANVGDPHQDVIAYFSAEFGLHHALPFYAGGLGFLAGDFLKECSDLGIPLVGLGFMYPQGYLRQKITPNGWQAGACEIVDRENAPIRRVVDKDGNPLVVRVPIIDPPIFLAVWKVQVGRTELYLMDTAIEANTPENRLISDRLYAGNPEQRLRQEILLGIGGVAVLRALGKSFSILHLNEGHPAFAVLERIRELMGEGQSFEDAFEMVRSTTVFTTHTPVPAGHDVFPFELMKKYFSSYLPALRLDYQRLFELGTNPASTSGFNMTAFALRASAYHNCVSKRHQEVTREMWHSMWPDLKVDEVPIDYVTNGVHVPSWIDRRLGDVILNRYLGRDWLDEQDNPRIWELIDEIPDEIVWEHHNLMKRMLISKIRERARLKWLDKETADPNIVMASGVLLDPTALTLGFARRFASYKRPTLMLQDMERLKRIVNNMWRPVQIIFAGKAHPDDQFSKETLQRVFNAAKDQSFGGRIAFVEDYDEQLAQYLVHGVDVWVNNPLPPMEASGTSGMKATLNGVPQLSTLDGWWIEGYNGKNGWAFQGAEGENRDQLDAQAIYEILENEVVPAFYEVDKEGVPRRWVRFMKEAMKMTGPHFSARRMAKEYTEKFYSQSLLASIKMETKKYRKLDTREIKGDVFRHF
ncbi:MAG: glycosyltransferase family 1 protein [Methanosarcinales archaeon]|nr:glycosyltransferase family 1 protein [Methanosarcinales archaeon]